MRSGASQRQEPSLEPERAAPYRIRLAPTEREAPQAVTHSATLSGVSFPRLDSGDTAETVSLGAVVAE